MTKILLEALYYSGGLKSKLYGAETRPLHWPPLDRIGLHNDIVLEGQQFAVELSRFRTRIQSGATGITWLAVLRTSSDIVGNRDNFCGAGLWLLDGVRFEAATALDLLFKVSLRLQQNIPRDFGATLPRPIDEAFERAAEFVNEHFVIDPAIVESGMPYGDERNFSSQYIVLSGMDEGQSELADAIATVCATRTNVTATRLVFVSGSDVHLDAARTGALVLGGLSSIYVHGRAVSDLVNELCLAKGALEGARTAREHLEREVTELKARDLESALQIKGLETRISERDDLLDLVTRPEHAEHPVGEREMLSEPVGRGFGAKADNARKNRKLRGEQEVEMPGLMGAVSSNVDLRSIKATLDRIESRMMFLDPRATGLGPQEEKSRPIPSFLQRYWIPIVLVVLITAVAASILLDQHF